MTDRVSTTSGDTPVETAPDDYAREKRWFRLKTGRDAGKRLFFRDEVHGGECPEHTVVYIEIPSRKPTALAVGGSRRDEKQSPFDGRPTLPIKT